ncbi:hypothetical protein [Sphingomonas alpina]|uniref:Tetratricopeptide repeat protein n=1 Tax=Sphingomonas alpina TaxID=653931 RepID=A0A7H0LDD5_9SPHN|nr:hypothetical protein [Sphingomonas alpina]QNQ07688.1 hypothetical protein H3Z74_12745 [Sphingomonas alpina]
MPQRNLLYSSATRWALAGVLVVATGWASLSHVYRAAYRRIDAVTIVLGDDPEILRTRLIDVNGGLAIKFDPAELARLRQRLTSKPLDGTAFALVALDATAKGDKERAAKLVAHALALEPRTRLAWLWRLDQQMRNGRTVEAANSTLRLLSVDPSQYPNYVPILARLAKDRRNISQIAAALRGNPGWRGPFLSTLQTNGFDPAIRFAIMDAGNSNVYTIEQERAAFVADLITKADYERAYLAWVSYLPESALASVDTPYDAHFKGMPGPPPFNWQLTAADGDRAETNNGLDLSYSGRKPVTLATQVVVLQPGGYRLRSTVANANSEGPSSGGTTLTWQAYCLPGNRPIGNLALDINVTGKPQLSAPFDVPETCQAVSLSLTGAASEFPVRLNARIAAVQFERATAPTSAPDSAAISTSAIPSPQPSVTP